jgi:hypothetical protein
VRGWCHLRNSRLTSYFLTARLAPGGWSRINRGVIMTVSALPARTGTRLNGGYGEAPFLGTHPVDSTQYARRSPRGYSLSKAWMKAGFNGRRRPVFPVASKRAAAMAGAASAFAASDPPP